ncbi:MAG: CRISPR-associated endonuclease Cas2 [Epulopiscium sp. Nele67-Bin005]|nr:MAG: CRISPR-associated endonuclease Cas2 [Epulopiscium sp. Nele67-Bin005]
MYVILIYDIKADEQGPRVWSKTFKSCKKYLTHVQKSVFEGEITEDKLLKLQKELGLFIRKDLDSVIVYETNNPKWLHRKMWALQEDKMDNFF